MIAILTPTTMAYARLALRALQFVCCLFTLAFAAASFRGDIATDSSIFTLLMGYTGMLYTLWFVAAIEVFHIANRLPQRVEQAVDALLALVLLIAGICLAASDYVSNCSIYLLTKCNNLRAAVAFSFIAMFFFLVSIALSFVTTSEPSQGFTDDVQVEEPVPYRMEATPTGALSPIGDTKETPAAKV